MAGLIATLVLAVTLPRLELLQPIKTGKAPYGLQVSRDGRRLFVANFASDEVGVLDLTDPKDKMKMFYAGPEPIDLALTPSGDKLFVANVRVGLITVVSTGDLRMADNIKVGGKPVALAMSENGSRLFVANWGRSRTGEINVIDVQTNEVIKTVKVGVRPVAVAASEKGDIAYVANGGSNSITRVEVATEAVREFPCLENPDGVALSVDGKWLYVAGANGSELAVMDTATGKEVRRAAVGAGPAGVAVHPGGWVLTADKGAGTLSVVAGDLSGTVKVKVGESPNDVALDADGKTAYVSLEKDNRIAVVKLQ